MKFLIFVLNCEHYHKEPDNSLLIDDENKTLKTFYYFYFICMSVLPLCVYVTMGMKCLQRSKEDIGSPGTSFCHVGAGNLTSSSPATINTV